MQFGIARRAAPGRGSALDAPGRLGERADEDLRKIVTPEAEATLRATAEEVKGQFNSATEQEKATKIARDRALKLYKTQAGSKRNWEEAEAQYKIACEAVKAAGKRLDALTHQDAPSAQDRTNERPATVRAPYDFD